MPYCVQAYLPKLSFSHVFRRDKCTPVGEFGDDAMILRGGILIKVRGQILQGNQSMYQGKGTDRPGRLGLSFVRQQVPRAEKLPSKLVRRRSWAQPLHF